MAGARGSGYDSAMARVPYAEPAAGILDLNLFRALSNQPQVARGVSELGGRLLFRGTLPAGLRELVILRVAGSRGCAYELLHHRRIGAQCGLTPARIEAAVGGGEGLTEAELAALDLATAVDAGGASDAEWNRAAAHFGPDQLVELTVLGAFYGMLARVITTFELEPDGEARAPAARG